MSGTRTVHARIEGRVQGVGYRAWAERTAVALGLTGWVRNRADGTVEAVFQGAAEVVADMLRRCEEGPRHAQVERVEAQEEETETYDHFTVRG